ncbi:hypothetical protein [Bradyrhizobium sp.]|uniref:hypothetical protein n=1 Tax=Bradyrhizobium sp. TaxID=376 RepID=UPI002385F000|nr:hypothetical protein [Bradyrhizobium sp.]MDE2378574.1 hypothetical protein [Bradyrhizobium sp.]
MFLEFTDLVTRGDKAELFKRCMNRCFGAVSVCYEAEKARAGSLWDFDERYHEHGVQMLYERFSYAMAQVADRFSEDYRELYHSNEAQKKALTFATFLSGAVDETFKRVIRDMGFSDATLAYYEEDYFDDGYDAYWDSRPRLKAAVAAVRKEFAPEERTFMHGFSRDDDPDDDDADNRDCLHIMRMAGESGDIDVRKFLTATKREYLPLMIRLFLATPKRDIFAKPAKWWQFWNRG